MTQHGPLLRIKYNPEQAQKAMADLAAAVGVIAAEISEAFKRTLIAPQDLGIASQTTTDPRPRALWAKQHRGTGPATPRNWANR